MKKIFILVLYLFLLTGCEVNYEMEFNDDRYSHSYSIFS